MNQQKFSIKERLKSFGYAMNGFKILIRDEHNSRIQLVAAVIVIISGIVLKISAGNWTAIAFAIGLVFALELLNSGIEQIADFISPEKHDAIKKIKDLSAASVLIGAITAFIIGLLVFIPKILELC